VELITGLAEGIAAFKLAQVPGTPKASNARPAIR
jgi:hypothetical protein